MQKKNERVEMDMKHRATAFGIVFLVLVLCFSSVCHAEREDTLDRVVILSRHNIRSPLSGSGSLLGDIKAIL